MGMGAIRGGQILLEKSGAANGMILHQWCSRRRLLLTLTCETGDSVLQTPSLREPCPEWSLLTIRRLGIPRT
jgi:hypothetical protein